MHTIPLLRHFQDCLAFEDFLKKGKKERNVRQEIGFADNHIEQIKTTLPRPSLNLKFKRMQLREKNGLLTTETTELISMNQEMEGIHKG